MLTGEGRLAPPPELLQLVVNKAIAVSAINVNTNVFISGIQKVKTFRFYITNTMPVSKYFRSF